MRQQPWLTCGDPDDMLKLLGPRASPRKLRLLAVACWRHLFGEQVEDDRTRAALEVAERYADGLAAKGELVAARTAAGEAHETSWRAKRAAWWATYGRPLAAVRGVIAQPVPPPWQTNAVRAPRARPAPLSAPARAAVCRVMRDLFGNPSLPASVDPGWLAPAVVSLARQVYEGRDFAALPVLADALEEAGCRNPLVLSHCRSGGEHARGCWVLDSLTGRE